MTRSIRPKFDDGGLKPEPKPIYLVQTPSFGQQIGMFLLVLFFMGAACVWILNDVTGEYACEDRKQGLVRLSLVRRVTSVKGQLSYGRGAFMEMEVPSVDPSKGFVWTFRTPDKWVNLGQPRRSARFVGNIHDGTISGVIQEGSRVMPVSMSRNGIASISRQFQAHLPWVD